MIITINKKTTSDERTDNSILIVMDDLLKYLVQKAYSKKALPIGKVCV